MVDEVGPEVDDFSQSRPPSFCVPLTSNLKWQDAPGNVLLSAKSTGLPKESVANVSLVVAVDKRQLTECVGKLTRRELDLVLGGIDTVLGR